MTRSATSGADGRRPLDALGASVYRSSVDPVTIYEEELPPADDPDVAQLARELIARARADQRPGRALLAGLGSVAIGVVIWGELNRWTGFDMPWLLMAGSAVALGVLMGLPYRKVGALFDARWALVAGALGVLMGVLGDLHATALIVSTTDGVRWADVLRDLDLATWLAHRQPLDWIVSGLGGAGAFAAARPALDERQLVMEARIAVHAQDLADDDRADEDESS